jgi:hypothetical protein
MPQNVSRPIDHVPTAGTRTGHANGAETTKPGLRATEASLEDGEGTLSSHPHPGHSANPALQSPPIPSINVELVQSSKMSEVSL